MSQITATRASWHLPTAMALSAFAWMLLMSGHEVLGHGGGCVALGGKALSVDAMYFECSKLSTLWRDQLYRAGGSLFNVLLAIGSIVALRRLSNPRSWLGYFLWVSAILNFLQSGSYIAFGRFIHPGMDWAVIVAAAPNSELWAAIVTLAGVALIASALWVGRLYEPLFLSPATPPTRQKVGLLMTPYLTATAVSVAASAFVPSDDRLMMLLGGVGNSLFFLAPMLVLLAWPTRVANLLEGNPSFAPRTRLVVLALVTTLLYVFVIAPGIEIG